MSITIVLLIGITIWVTICLTKPLQYTGAVVANGVECAQIGRDILQKGGSAADAVIGTLFCEGITSPQSMGLGGGFFLTIYERASGTVETLCAREVAPNQSYKTMFENVTKVTGPKSIAVPGDLKGYWELHQKYGRLNWSTLIQPSIDLCRNGFIVTKFLGRCLNTRPEMIMNSPGLREVFVNSKTGRMWQAGDTITCLKLAETLEIIAKDGVDTLYNNGTIARQLVSELNSLGGMLTIEDLMNYTVLWQEPESTIFSDGKTIYSIPLPGSGSILMFIINVLNGFLSDKLTITDYQRIVETYKYAYGKRTHLGDPMFVPNVMQIISDLRNLSFAMDIRSKIKDDRTFQDYEHYDGDFSDFIDHGTAHVSVLAPNGDAVSVTSTINTIFGSKIRSRATGIILNDQMDDFSAPNVTNAYGLISSPANFIEPNKRPMSSMCPAIIVNRKGDAEFIIGAAGGSKITSSIAYVIARHFWFGQSLENAIDAKRIHHQLAPMAIESEHEFDENILRELEIIGHQIIRIEPEDGFASVSGISQKNGYIEAVFDKRRYGSFVIF